MSKYINYYDIAGELQTKAMQFSSLASITLHIYSKEEFALKYIDDLMDTLKKYKRALKKELEEEMVNNGL